MANENLLASGIANVPHLAAFDETVRHRFENLELEALCVYLIDVVPASVLPYLAAQFDILGIKGYGFAQTEAQKREVLKNAIELHRYKGTPWAVKAAVLKFGYQIGIIERTGTSPFYNGTHQYNGTITYTGGDYHWSNFDITVDPVAYPNVFADLPKIIEIVNEYKPARSHLRATNLRLPTIIDIVGVSDSVTTNASLSAWSGLGPFYNGMLTYNGAATYSGGVSDTVIPPAPITNFTPVDILGLKYWADPSSLVTALRPNGFNISVTNGSVTGTVTGGTYVAGMYIKLASGALMRIATVAGTTLTFTTAFTGTTGTYAVEITRVTSWPSLGGTGRTATAPLAGAEPYLIEGSAAGIAGDILFMGSADYLSLSPIIGSNPTNLRMIGVVEAGASSQEVLFSHRSSTTALIQFNYDATTGGIKAQMRSTTSALNTITDGTPATGSGLGAWSFTQGGGSQTLETWVDGDYTNAATTTQSLTGTFTATTELIGRWFNGTSTFNGFAGYITELVIFDGTFSEMEMTEGYLAHKYGITSRLPASHPYKYFSP